MLVLLPPMVLLTVVTSTLTVQTLFGDVEVPVIVPPLKLKVVVLAAGDHVGVPQLVVDAFGVAATFRFEGSVSLKLTAVSVVEAFVLVIVNVTVAVEPAGMVAGENDFVNVGAFGSGGLALAQVKVTLSSAATAFDVLLALANKIRKIVEVPLLDAVADAG
jgi:hypothetical protein